ncbi:MAG: hydrolase [Zetaproteobacteria bacterium]|nr:MAG: hydrolase [Zetaproteobacteria bacterium]
MASFNTHIAVAGLAAGAGGAIAWSAGMVDVYQAGWLVALGTVAGVLPDVDSDHSRSLRLVFTLLSVALLGLLMVVAPATAGWRARLALAAALLLAMRYLVYPAFARLTVHRGLFHSVPAAMLTGLFAFVLMRACFDWRIQPSRLAGLFVAGGYLVHLLLDECYSVNLAGHRLKASFGSAMTLFSLREWRGYVLLYLAVLAGFWLMPRLAGWV